MPKRTLTAALAACCGAALPLAASAYTIATPADPGCHERITTDALRLVRMARPGAAAITPSADEAALIADLQFIPEADVSDLGGATLLMAVRDNDLKGRGSAELDQLAEVHGDPELQREHCLRSPDQGEPGGTEAALADCRAYIVERYTEALDGLDGQGAVDRSKRVILTVHGELRGTQDALLPTYYVRMGQALHTLEDAFTHTYRTPDQQQPTVALNWVEFVNRTLVEATDGPAHHADLDRCDDPSDLHRRRRELATAAAVEVLSASLTSTMTRDQKLAALETTLDRYLAYQPGCTAENAWCNAPEAALPAPSGCGCQTSDTGGAGVIATLLGAIALFSVARRRLAAVLPVLAVAMLAAAPLSAHAQEGEADTGTTTVGKPTVDDEGVPLTPAERAAIPAPPKVPVAEPGSLDPDEFTFGAYLGAAGSYDEPALAFTLGLRLRVSKHWKFGLDGEWNPWIALNTSGLRAGSANLYLSAIFLLPLVYEDFNLRSAVSLGGSYLLTDLYGAPAGSVGLFIGVAPLGLEWKLSESFYLVINPLSIGTPIPHLTGVPLVYPQYRLTVGLEFGR